MKMFNQRFERGKFANTALPLTLYRIELLILHHICTKCGVLDHGHRWRARNEFTSLIVFG